MIRRLDLRGAKLGARELREAVPRAELDVEQAVETVRPICQDVRDRGVAALLDLTERFDGVRPDTLRVPAQALDDALAHLDPAVRQALAESIRRARLVHRDQRRRDTTTQVVPGGTVTERWVPVERVGLYVPGGLAVYPSSVVMNVVPAQEAGVCSIAVASPPGPDLGNGRNGLPHPTIMAACAMLGIDELYAVGGAQAIAMFAHGADDADGTPVCEPVDLVTGPGNIYVAAAKRLLRGTIGIDSEAGPTEIAILADSSADPLHLAADMISQAEHDPMAGIVLVTDCPDLVDRTCECLTDLLPRTRHAERATTALGGAQSAIIVVDDIDAGLKVVDAFAAEHLEVHTRDAATIAARVRNAGAVFVGPWSPVSLGDYCAGSNHVLPTGGCARHSSGLSVQSFLRGVHVVVYDEQALRDVGPQVYALAEAEGLPAHAQAVQARLEPQALYPSESS